MGISAAAPGSYSQPLPNAWPLPSDVLRIGEEHGEARDREIRRPDGRAAPCDRADNGRRSGPVGRRAGARAGSDGQGHLHFVWQPTTASLGGDSTYINNGATNGQAKDLLFVTPNLTPGGLSPCPCLISPQPPVGVWYNGTQWAVFNEDASSMSTFWSYNVLVVPKASKSAFVAKATVANTIGNRTLLNSKLLNGKPDALILVTQDYDPDGVGGIFNDHQVGVRYYKPRKRWGIFNEGGGAMPTGAAFNVLVSQTASNGGKMSVLKATSSNHVGDAVLINNSQTNGNPNNATFVTQDYNPGAKGGISDVYPAVVTYGGTKEAVLNWGGTEKVGTGYNVLIFSS